ncbi:serine/arginine-rich splicing factor 7-like isoform X2 [Chelonus insularis]|uniref:serine/arginine-rich splicing factor 7-like isoform X2 n=1 Tax=Chelonus insularis TaxID=460826 RepID=UPI001588B458|nr:serine/arginine-rich splicing factor 7-like isoform X2 [Chelonus insularis]
MSQMSRYPSDCKVYVGDLGNSATKQDLENAFSYYGPLKNVWVARNPPGFAFVEFEDARDADDAVRALDGRTICGRKARVERSNGKRLRDRGRRGGGGGGGRQFHPEDRCYECGERGHYARDCYKHRGGRKRKSYSRSRSRSRSKRSRSRSSSHSRSRSRSNRRGKSRSKTRSDSKDRSPIERSRSRSPSNRSRSRQ